MNISVCLLIYELLKSNNFIQPSEQWFYFAVPFHEIRFYLTCSCPYDDVLCLVWTLTSFFPQIQFVTTRGRLEVCKRSKSKQEGVHAFRNAVRFVRYQFLILLFLISYCIFCFSIKVHKAIQNMFSTAGWTGTLLFVLTRCRCS